jgi:nanoRNase/pAp phosphatase (c-di-AMP/oligoRNAs hydrolase)
MEKEKMADKDKYQDLLKGIENPKVRARGESGSPQNSLRFKLYKAAFERIEDGIKNGSFFEVISIADSLITDRIQALVQFLRREEPEHYVHTSIGLALELLQVEVKSRNFDLGEEFKSHRKKLNEWVQERNIAAHGFVTITRKNLNQDLDHRLEHLKTTAITGAELARTTTNITTRILREQHAKG